MNNLQEALQNFLPVITRRDLSKNGAIRLIYSQIKNHGKKAERKAALLFVPEARKVAQNPRYFTRIVLLCAILFSERVPESSPPSKKNGRGEPIL